MIGEIRRALGDDRQAPRFIRTVHGVGYAFCGQAVDVGDADVGARAVPGSRCWLSWKESIVCLDDGDNVIGRDPRSASGSIDESVSRRHAMISVRADGAGRRSREHEREFLNRERSIHPLCSGWRRRPRRRAEADVSHDVRQPARTSRLRDIPAGASPTLTALLS